MKKTKPEAGPVCVSCVDPHTAGVERSKIISNPAFILFSSHYNSLQIRRPEAGESRQRAGGGERPQPGGGRLLVLDSVIRHLSAGRSKTAQRRAAVQDAPCRRVPPHNVRQTPQVRMSAHFSSQLFGFIVDGGGTFWRNCVFPSSTYEVSSCHSH